MNLIDQLLIQNGMSLTIGTNWYKQEVIVINNEKKILCIVCKYEKGIENSEVKEASVDNHDIMICSHGHLFMTIKYKIQDKNHRSNNA